MNTWKKFAGLVGVGALVMAVAAPALAGENWATVTGHSAASPESNDPGFWGENCIKLNTGEGDLGDEQHTYTLGADFGLVVVKSGAGEFANTLFEDASAGEVVWADTNGSGVFDEGDQAISHIIFCDEEEEETEEPSFEQSQEGETDEPSFEQSQEGETDEPSEPDTATIGGSSGVGGPADGAWLLVVALGVLLASIVVLTPARARVRR